MYVGLLASALVQCPAPGRLRAAAISSGTLAQCAIGWLESRQPKHRCVGTPLGGSACLGLPAISFLPPPPRLASRPLDGPSGLLTAQCLHVALCLSPFRVFLFPFLSLICAPSVSISVPRLRFESGRASGYDPRSVPAHAHTRSIQPAFAS